MVKDPFELRLFEDEDPLFSKSVPIKIKVRKLSVKMMAKVFVTYVLFIPQNVDFDHRTWTLPQKV